MFLVDYGNYPLRSSQIIAYTPIAFRYPAMIKRTFSCDICRDVKESPQTDLIAFDFGPGNVIRPAAEYFRCERHICIPCLKGMVAMAATVDVAKRLKEAV